MLPSLFPDLLFFVTDAWSNNALQLCKSYLLNLICRCVCACVFDLKNKKQKEKQQNETLMKHFTTGLDPKHHHTPLKIILNWFNGNRKLPHLGKETSNRHADCFIFKKSTMSSIKRRYLDITNMWGPLKYLQRARLAWLNYSLTENLILEKNFIWDQTC